MHTTQEEDKEMDNEVVLIKQIHETEDIIANTLSRCEKMVDNELVELSSMTKRSSEDLFKSVASRVVDKLLSLLHQQPTALLGVEEAVEWIEREVRGTGDGGGFEFTEELVDVAYDVEDAVDSLQLKSAAEASGRGSLEYVIATDDDPLRKQLSGLPAPDHTELCPLDSPQDTEETASPDMNSAQSQSMSNTVVCPITEGVTALLALKALHPKMKKVARRIQDKFRLMNDFLKDFDRSGAVDHNGMVRMEELLTVSSSAVDVMEELINKREQLRRSWVEPLGRVVFDFHNFKSQHMLAMEIDKIYSKILNISTRKREEVPGNSQSTVPAANAFPIQPLLRFVGMTEEEREEKFKKEMDEIMTWVMKLGDMKCMAERVVSRIIEKLSVLLVRDPWAVVGVEDQLQWVEGELKRAGAHYELAEELIDVAYDVEDVIDDLILKSVAQAGSRGALENVIATDDDDDQLHKKLESIKPKINALPPPSRVVQCSLDPPQDIEEIDWSQRSSAFDQKISNTVVSPVIKKVTALLDQGALPTRVKKSARQVQDKFRLMNDFLRDLESVELDNRWRVWIDELCQVCHSTEDVIDQFLNSREQIGRSWSGALRRGVLGFGHLIAQHKLVMKMDQISAQILDLSSRRPERAHGHSPSTVPRYAPPIPQPPTQEPQQTQELDVINFDDDVHAIMTWLLSDDTSFSVISIVGMPGIGKTTLAKLIYNNKAVVDHFPFRAWTSATHEHKFFRDIMGEHTNYRERTRGGKRFIIVPDDAEMAHKLNAFLTGKRYLIVLDDASSTNFLNRMVKAFPDASNGSRMILISRSRSLPSELERRSVHHAVRLRGNDESWTLFTHALKVNIPQQLQTLRKEIVRTCGGLPMLIVKLANMLSQKGLTIEEWSNALQQLNRDQEQFWSYPLSRISKDLPLYMRQCLFYFGLFPQDFEIPARRLTALWVAEGLVQAKGEDEAPEDAAERCLIQLIAEGMVRVTKKKRNGNIKTCCLPGALQQCWLSKALNATFLQIHTKTTSHLSPSTGMIRRLTDHLDKEDITFDHIHGNHNIDSSSWQPLYRGVVSLLSFDTREGNKPGQDIGNFLHRCISNNCLLLLRVLDLENVFKPNLPGALGNLTRLRYLGLRSTFLDMLPSFIKKLENLQVLDLKHTNIITLPSPIWNMQRLRRLYLNERCHCQSVPQPRVGSFSTLQVLVGLFVDEEAPVKDGLDRFVNLQKLGLKCRLLSSQQEAMAEWVLKSKHLRSLSLKSIDEQNQVGDLDLKPLTGHVSLSCLYLLGRLKNPSIVSEFPHGLIDLTLSGSELKEDPMETLDKLPNLKILSLLAKSYTGNNMRCSLGGFSQLRVLKLWILEQLEEWNVEEGALQALRALDIRGCMRLKMLPEALHHRALLQVKLTDMPSDFA